MGRIGMENVPESIDGRFHSEEKEFLVMTIGGTSGSKCDGYWNKSIDILGYVEIESGRTSNIKSSLNWSVEDYKSDNNFKNGGIIYRIKGRLPKLLDGEPWINNEYRMSGLYATEIISENEKNDFLENLLTEYRKEVSVNSEVLGKLILNKELDWYETENNLEWCGEYVEFSISPDGENDINEFLPLAEEFYKNRQEWDKKLREFSASQLTELANDWLEDEYYEEDDEETEPVPEITEKDFANRISISGISFYTDGNFEVFYDDDDMFWGHSILIDGNIKTGKLESSHIAG
ncbi:MAG: DUF2262 domain-containing protein [Ruminococcus sp.]|nr:DUF2262 domain-containing protein [Ruminococcus sp.]